MSLEKVLVLLVDFNTSDLVPDVLKSIEETDVDVSVMLVDNGSSHDSFSKLKKITDPRVNLVRLDENVGFIKGNNFGLRYALEHFNNFKYVFLLNTDAFLTPNLIGNLKKILDENKDAACISPKIFARDGSTWYGGSQMNLKKGFVSSRVAVDENNPGRYYEVDVFNGCAVLFRLDRLLEVNMLNEDLFMYYEEADCSIKLRNIGYKILYAPQYTVLHYISYASRNNSHVKTYYMTRNKFIVFDKTMTWPSKAYYLLHEFAVLVKNKRFKNAAYHLRGFIDFKRGRKGQLSNSV